MGRYLVVANQTVGGERLAEELRRRMTAEPATFHVLVPQAPIGSGPALSSFAGEPSVLDASRVSDEEAQRRAALTAESRLQQLLVRIRTEGGTANGEVGGTDPIEAITSVLSRGEQFDEIIISTLPTGVSRWLRLDVPHRVERRFRVPVTTVTAKA